MALFKHQKQQDSVSVKRARMLAVIMVVGGVLIITKLFVMQVVKHSQYKTVASENQEVSRNILANRGSIFTKEQGELHPLVADLNYYLLYAEPKNIKDSSKIIDTITPILGLKDEEWKALAPKLANQSDPYEPIKHKVSEQQKKEIEAAKLEGLGFSVEPNRYYPEKEIGGHIFGFVSTDGDDQSGRYGLEGYFNKQLSGQRGLLTSIRDAVGSLITIGPRQVKKAQDGSDIVLTIDRAIQYTTCQRLKHYYEWFKADAGTVIIMEPTGAILAMCSFPDFDPENYGETKDIYTFNNPAIFQAFEPGSVFKMITMASGLDAGAVSPDTTYEDFGSIKVDKFTIKNSDLKAHGKQTMTEVLEKSLNTGAIFVEQKVGKEKFRDYVKAFGFGQLTGITLDTEMPGDISLLDEKGPIYGMTASFGQGITATPIQLVTAFASIANRGKLMRPYIVSEINSSDGTKQVFGPEEVRQAVQPKSAALITGMLTSVVENSYSQKAKVPGYYIAGKSGTAQVAGSNGGYGGATNHSFIGFGPVSNPRFVILVTLFNPKGVRFAEGSSVPLFGELAEYLLNYYHVQPDY